MAGREAGPVGLGAIWAWSAAETGSGDGFKLVRVGVAVGWLFVGSMVLL